MTFYLNLQNSQKTVTVDPASGLTLIGNTAPPSAYPFIQQLVPTNSAKCCVWAAQQAATQSLDNTEIVAVGGDKAIVWWATEWLYNQVLLTHGPNDGVIPVSSALPADTPLPNLVRLLGGDPTPSDLPFPHDHSGLVNSPDVMSAVLAELEGNGLTASVLVSPQSVQLAPGAATSFTATGQGVLNPQFQWSVAGGSTSGTVNPVTGSPVQYTAPDAAGTYYLTASVPNVSDFMARTKWPENVATITVAASNPVPSIVSFSPPSLLAGASAQTLTITGTGFVPGSTASYNGVVHTPTYVDTSHLTISLTSADLAAAGAYPIVITNPAPGGGSSAPLNFVVAAACPAGATTISTANDLNTLVRARLSGLYCLAKDIDLSSISNWTPIGDSTTPFTGSLYGLGHTISNLTIVSSAGPAGLFGAVVGGTIANVGLANVGIQVSVTTPNTYPSVGSLAGILTSSTVVGSYAAGKISVNLTGGGSGLSVGGLIGSLSIGGITGSNADVVVLVTGGAVGGGGVGGLVGSSSGTIARSYAAGSVTSRSVNAPCCLYGIGGLVGTNAAAIQESYATGEVDSDTGTITGGLVGLAAWDYGTISRSYATGGVKGGDTSWVGGLVGWVWDVTVSQSYASGDVSGGANGTVGGLAGKVGGGCWPCSASVSESYAVGRVSAGTGGAAGGLIAVSGADGAVSNSYWDTNTSGQSASAGGTGETTTQLQSGTLPGGFDSTTWKTVLGQYPLLVW